MRLNYPLFALLSLLLGCVLKEDSPVESFNNAGNVIQSGDIVVINTPNDSILLLDRNGNYKSTLVNEADPASVILGGLNYDSVSKRILFTYDHATASLDELRGISLFNARVDTVLNNSFLTATNTFGAPARLTNGDYLILETATTVEKFSSSFVRQTTTAPFSTAFLITANVQLEALSTGGFLACATGTANTVRTYNLAGTVVATATSAAPTPSLGALAASGCSERPDGTIVVAYSGATDTVRAYSSDLGTVLWDFTNASVLSTPGRVTVRANGNVLVTDTAFNHIVEISSSGAFVQTLAGSVLSTPGHIEVIP